MNPLTRRKFLRQSLITTAAALVTLRVRAATSVSAVAPFSKVVGANDTVRIAVVGVGSSVKIGGKGKQDIEAWRRIPGVRVAAICDVEQTHLAAEAEKFRQRGEKVETYTDVRRLLENKEIDAISIATPNHWHSLMAIWACQAGKDVFIQKPASHNLFEGRKMVEAARKYGRAVMVITNSRSGGGIIEALDFARQGNLGKMLFVQGVNYKPRTSIGKVSAPTPIPTTLDYDLWSGPAPIRPVMREFLHYDWHWDWNYGNGELGNMGSHYLDGCRIALGLDRLPRSVMSMGGRFGYDDDGMTPNSLVTFLDYETVPVIFELRGLPKEQSLRQGDWEKTPDKTMDSYRGAQMGVTVQCANGYVVNNTAYDAAGNVVQRFRTTRESMYANFANVVRSRKMADLQGDVLQGHLSSGMSHLANASYRLGSAASPAEIKERIQGNKESQAAYNRFQAHLDANRIDFSKTPVMVGPLLTVDNTTEKFVGEFSAEANPLLTRDYRPPYVVPDKV